MRRAFPGFYRRSIVVSPTVSDGAVKMWGANARLNSFCYRYELEWKDKIYCDVHFNITNDCCVDIDCEFTNNTESMQNLSMNLCAGMRFPHTHFVKTTVAAECIAIDAADYDEIEGDFAIAQDGKYLGETEAVGASEFNTAVKCGKGVRVSYRSVQPADSVGIRFSAPVGEEITVNVNSKKFIFRADTENFDYHVVHFASCTVEKIEITADCEAFIDCIIVGFGAEKCTFEVCKIYSSLCDDGHQTGSGLLKTWHIFYNSGGWDDYPPQTAVHKNSLSGVCGNTNDTTPVITTACVVLIAKIMKRIANLFCMEDTGNFDNDIKKYSEVIQKYLWDDEAGYYSYMIHDENGTPHEFLRYNDGTNYNCGFDGIYPYIAGISDSYQQKRVICNIKNGLMTQYGVGTVDIRVPYYSDSGYWNGSVWMPHQWILWKSLLDTGETELAAEIAQKAVKTWSTEVCDSYSCFENFMVRTGRGSGYHAFSGLSTPVLMFYEALYSPGSVTTGFFTSVKSTRFSCNNSELELTVDASADTSTVIVCMNSDFDYSFTVRGETAYVQKVTDGAYFVKLRKCGESVIIAQRQ